MKFVYIMNLDRKCLILYTPGEEIKFTISKIDPLIYIKKIIPLPELDSCLILYICQKGDKPVRDTEIQYPLF